ncbi:NHL domain-containing protein [Microlunatus parietis]|uniref:Sugar lactone lactonase YvrE n=1 Tax=Microlunatus parietis TaxID=682979 RepID=A0A7Y9IDN4_9ACTN|nr:hypothetical protein [Microlunatus parietis]NYE74845.1 sugar lactone lactonase YvrE [Microlunatus parietis]
MIMVATISTVTGYGFDQTGFGGPAANVDLRQLGTSSRMLGHNQGIAVDADGRILVSATVNNVVGRIAAPASWTEQPLGEALTAPTGALPWRFYSPSAAAVGAFAATTYQDQSAVHYVATNADRHTVLYLQPTIIAGATGVGRLTVVGSGTVVLNLYNGRVEIYSQTITLSDTPQTLIAEKVFAPGALDFKLRSPIAQERIEAIVFGASIQQRQVTGATAPIAGRMARLGGDGDGGPATEARLNAPAGIAVGPDGTVVIADSYNHRIRAVDPRGRIRTIAGTGESGDGGSSRAVDCRLDHPGGVAVDARGTVYVADTYNHRIRAVSPGGSIRTIAGTGEAGADGARDLATRTRLNHPQGVAVDAAGNVYVADTYNHRILRIHPHGRVSIVAGTGTAGFGGDGGPAAAAQLATPHDVEVAADGTLYVADTLNNRIRRIAGGTIATYSGVGTYGGTGRAGGPASAAQLAHPVGVAADPRSGDLYVVESTQGVLRIQP